MKKPDITILIPTYLRPALLVRAIHSILDQSYKNFIIRVHDNGSDTETHQIMLGMSKKNDAIKYKRHDFNIGASKNCESLLDMVDTPFYILMSDDDFLLPGHLEAGLSALTKYNEALFYSSATLTANIENNFLQIRNQTWVEGFYRPSVEIVKRVSGEHFTSTGTIFRKRVLDIFGGFHGIGRDDILSVILTGCLPFYATPRLGAVFTINEKRSRWHLFKTMTLEQILLSGASDRKFVINHSFPETTFQLLFYLEKAYSAILENQSVYNYKYKIYQNNNTTDSLEELNFFLFRRSPYNFIKASVSEQVIDLLLLIKMLPKLGRTDSAKSKIMLSEFKAVDSLNYLRSGPVKDRQSFIDELECLKGRIQK